MKTLDNIRTAIRRQHAHGLSDRQIGEALGEPRGRICQFRRHMGLPCNTDRLFGERDRRIIRLNYRQIPVWVIARALNKTITSIYLAARRLGLSRSFPRLIDRPGLVETVKARHAEGWSDGEISREVGADRHRVAALRRNIGLPANVWTEHLRDRVRLKTAEQLRKAGLPNLAYLRVEAFKKYARDRGWPEDLKKRQVQILELIWRNGPMTRRDLAEALGLCKIARKLPGGRIGFWYPMQCNTPGHGADNSYTGDLLRKGLLISLGRIVHNKPAGARSGQGHNTVLYSLPLTIERKRDAKQA